MRSPSQAPHSSRPCAVTTKPGFKTNIPMNCCGRATPAKKTQAKLYQNHAASSVRASN